MALEDRRPRQFQGMLGELDRQACKVLLGGGGGGGHIRTGPRCLPPWICLGTALPLQGRCARHSKSVMQDSPRIHLRNDNPMASAHFQWQWMPVAYVHAHFQWQWMPVAYVHATLNQLLVAGSKPTGRGVDSPSSSKLRVCWHFRQGRSNLPILLRSEVPVLVLEVPFLLRSLLFLLLLLLEGQLLLLLPVIVLEVPFLLLSLLFLLLLEVHVFSFCYP